MERTTSECGGKLHIWRLSPSNSHIPGRMPTGWKMFLCPWCGGNTWYNPVRSVPLQCVWENCIYEGSPTPKFIHLFLWWNSNMSTRKYDILLPHKNVKAGSWLSPLKKFALPIMTPFHCTCQILVSRGRTFSSALTRSNFQCNLAHLFRSKSHFNQWDLLPWKKESSGLQP